MSGEAGRTLRVRVEGPSPVLVRGISVLLAGSPGISVVEHGPADVAVLLEVAPAPDGCPAVAVRAPDAPDAPVAVVRATVVAIVGGVRAVVDPHQGGAALVDAVRCVADGGHRLDRGHVDALAEALARSRDRASAPVVLTRRERDVLRCVRQGLSIKQTAAELGVSVKTVENTQRLMFTKLGVRTRAQAIARTHTLNTDVA
jgi:DNA-binding NarL/FixJ family response regulator